jgi:hypothetical protein
MRINHSWQRKLLAKGFFAHHHFNFLGALASRRLTGLRCPTAGRKFPKVKIRFSQNIVIGSRGGFGNALMQGIGNKRVKMNS